VSEARSQVASRWSSDLFRCDIPIRPPHFVICSVAQGTMTQESVETANPDKVRGSDIAYICALNISHTRGRGQQSKPASEAVLEITQDVDPVAEAMTSPKTLLVVRSSVRKFRRAEFKAAKDNCNKEQVSEN